MQAMSVSCAIITCSPYYFPPAAAHTGLPVRLLVNLCPLGSDPRPLARCDRLQWPMASSKRSNEHCVVG
eukprot:scaffold319540_cov33-Tisochrysis_lutea.AAC.1